MPEVEDLAEVHAMLAERVREWTQQWKEAGLREGLQQGLVTARALVPRLTSRRFGEAYAHALAPILETIDNPEVLAEIGEWIVTYETGDAFLARVRAQQSAP